MRQFKNFLIFACILFPLLALIYKYYFLNMSLVPKSVSNMWKIEISTRTDNLNLIDLEKVKKIKLPKPLTTLSQKVLNTKIQPGKAIEPSTSESPDGVVTPNKSWIKTKEKIQLTSKVKLNGFDYIIPNPEVKKIKLSKTDFQKYTSLEDLEESVKQDLIQVASSLVFENDGAMKKLEKFFFYVSDEFIFESKVDSLEDAITIKSGSYLGQARFISALARVYKIPSRISFGVQILKQFGKKTHKYNRVFYSEVFIEGKWIPINTHDKKFGLISDNFIVLHQDSEDFADIFENRALVSIYVEPLIYENLKSDFYVDQLKSQHPFWSAVSLHKFSLSIQSIFFGILLIPFGTVILSFMRIMVGINTFGIFTPILLSLFFLETSLVFGLLFFFVVVAIGLMQRMLLDKFYILAVPRLSILLTIVILLYIGFAILAENSGFLSVNNGTLNYFPIVIITVFIERFSIYFIEEGAYNTIKTTLGTFSVSLLCYLLLSVVWLKELIFNNPELIVLAIGVNLLIGNYKGYRLLEYLRFHQIADEA